MELETVSDQGRSPPDSHPSSGGRGYAHGCAHGCAHGHGHGHEGKRWARPASWLAAVDESARAPARLERRHGSHGTPRTAEKALYSAWQWAAATGDRAVPQGALGRPSSLIPHPFVRAACCVLP
jgi:hypothetical protein